MSFVSFYGPKRETNSDECGASTKKLNTGPQRNKLGTMWHRCVLHPHMPCAGGEGDRGLVSKFGNAADIANEYAIASSIRDSFNNHESADRYMIMPTICDGTISSLPDECRNQEKGEFNQLQHSYFKTTLQDAADVIENPKAIDGLATLIEGLDILFTKPGHDGASWFTRDWDNGHNVAVDSGTFRMRLFDFDKFGKIVDGKVFDFEGREMQISPKQLSASLYESVLEDLVPLVIENPRSLGKHPRTLAGLSSALKKASESERRPASP